MRARRVGARQLMLKQAGARPLARPSLRGNPSPSPSPSSTCVGGGELAGEALPAVGDAQELYQCVALAVVLIHQGHAHVARAVGLLWEVCKEQGGERPGCRGDRSRGAASTGTSAASAASAARLGRAQVDGGRVGAPLFKGHTPVTIVQDPSLRACGRREAARGGADTIADCWSVGREGGRAESRQAARRLRSARQRCRPARQGAPLGPRAVSSMETGLPSFSGRSFVSSASVPGSASQAMMMSFLEGRGGCGEGGGMWSAAAAACRAAVSGGSAKHHKQARAQLLTASRRCRCATAAGAPRGSRLSSGGRPAGEREMGERLRSWMDLGSTTAPSLAAGPLLIQPNHTPTCECSGSMGWRKWRARAGRSRRSGGAPGGAARKPVAAASASNERSWTSSA